MDEDFFPSPHTVPSHTLAGKPSLGANTDPNTSPFKSFPSICLRNPNLDGVHHHLQVTKPFLYLLIDTQPSSQTSVNYLFFPG